MFTRGIGARRLARGVVAVAGAAMNVSFAAAGVPVQHESQKLIASDGMPSDKFGFAVDREGDTLIIGAPQHYSNALPGSFYAFVRDQTGHWSERQRVFGDYVAGQAEFGDLFGTSLSLEGNTLLVGAPFMEQNGTMLVGLAYIFKRNSSGTWVKQQTLLPNDLNISRFGEHVALIGNTAVIVSSQRAFTFAPDASGHWSQQAELPGITLTFIDSMAFDGQTIALTGAFADSSLGALAYTRSGSTWTPSPPIIAQASSPAPLAFVRGASIDGDRLALGILDATAQDRAFVFQKSPAGAWSLQATLDPNTLDGDSFGIDVGIKGNLLLVGASNAGANGLVYVYQRVGTDWLQPIDLAPSDSFSHNFGDQIWLNQGAAVIGSWAHHENGLYAGAAYVFDMIAVPHIGDITGDGAVDIDDLLAVIAAWGPCPAPPASCPADVAPVGAPDGTVNVNDLLTIIANWG